MTYEELVKQLRTASIQCDEMRLRDFGYLMKCAADRIEELHNRLASVIRDLMIVGNKVPEWIPAEELPKESHDVLCYTDAYDMFIATYYGLDGDGEPIFDDNNGDYWEGNVIYWMPLPKPPKEV